MIRRILIILSLSGLVGLIWTFFGQTPWAATLDVTTAGEQFTQVVEPIRLMAGALLVAVPSVLLIRAGWAWFDVWVLGNQPRVRVRTDPRRSTAVAGSPIVAAQPIQRSAHRASPGTPDPSRPQSSPATVSTR